MRKTAIAKELIWNEHESITDVAALEDAKKSLSRMLEASLGFLVWRSSRMMPYVVGPYVSIMCVIFNPKNQSILRCAQDFIKDNYPEMTEDEKRALANSMDMRCAACVPHGGLVDACMEAWVSIGPIGRSIGLVDG